MSNKIILKSGDYILSTSCRNHVQLESEGDILFMTREEALSVAAALVSAANDGTAENTEADSTNC